MLIIGDIVLTFSKYHLKLIASCSLHLHVPQNLSLSSWYLPPSKLTCKDLWVARGDGLCIYVKLSLDGLAIAPHDRLTLIESLGDVIRRAEVRSRAMQN